jgi:hypothetical protein
MKWGPILGAAAVSIGFIINLSAAVPPASALSLELAKKCRALALNAHPYKLPGVKGPGTAASERDYYNECVARGGSMPQGNSYPSAEDRLVSRAEFVKT